MADSNTTITDLLLMETGQHNNDWGTNLNTVISNIETMTKSSRANATTGGTTTLSKTTAREIVQRVTGVLVSNAIIEVPAAAASWWIFKNETTGAFTLTVKVNGQTGVVVPQGTAMFLRCNGTDVVDLGMPLKGGVDIHSTAIAGTVDAIQITTSPPNTVWILNETVKWKSAGANTITAPTISKDGGVINKIIKKNASAALAVGDTGASGHECEGTYNGTDVILKNPANLASQTADNAFTGANTHAGLETDNGKHQFNGVVATKEQTIAYAASTALDPTLGADAVLTLTGNTTFGAITSQASHVGARGRIRIVQDGTGSRTVTWDSTFVMSDGTPIAINPVASTQTTFTYWIKAGAGAGSVILTPLAISSAWTKIAMLAPSGAATQDLTGLSAYRALRITLINVTVSTDDTQLLIRLSSDGATYLNTLYDTLIMDTVNPSVAGVTTAFELRARVSADADIGNAAGDGGISGTIEIYNFNVAQKTSMTGRWVFGDAGGSMRQASGQGWHNSQTAMQAIRFLAAAGNISGTIVVEGMI